MNISLHCRLVYLKYSRKVHAFQILAIQLYSLFNTFIMHSNATSSYFNLNFQCFPHCCLGCVSSKSKFVLSHQMSFAMWMIPILLTNIKCFVVLLFDFHIFRLYDKNDSNVGWNIEISIENCKYVKLSYTLIFIWLFVSKMATLEIVNTTYMYKIRNFKIIFSLFNFHLDS